jgi:transposase
MASEAPDRTAEVLRLSYVEGLGVRAIARRLSMARKTVRKLIGRGLPQRKEPADESRPSMLDRFVPQIQSWLAQTPELTAPAVLERLRSLGYGGGVSVLRERMRALRPPARREAFLTLDFHPGEAMQVDWADFGFAIPGCPRRVSAFVMALCYSRYLYLEFTLSQSMGTFLRCLERGLAFLGGTTAIEIYDNMKTVVLEPHPKHPVFNPRFMQYATARGFSVRACTPGRGNEKGRVERPIGFVRSRFWPGRRFPDLFDLNVQGTTWRDGFCNNRVHEGTGKVPSLVFAGEEKRLLKPLPPLPVETDDLLSTGVSKLFRVGFDRNRYSVPSRLVGQSVLVRADDETVSIFLGPKQVARHRRSFGIGEDIEDESHKRAAIEDKPRASGALPPGLAGLGETGSRYFQVFAATSRSLARESQRLTFLVELFGESATQSAVAEVMTTGHVGAEYVEYVLRHKRGLRPAPPPLRLGDPALDEIFLREPDLTAYDRPTPMTRDPGNPPEESSS